MDVVPTGPGFAAELRGVTLIDIASDDAAYAAARAAFEEHSVLVFRDQEVTDEIQLAFSRRFGSAEVTKVGSQGTGSHFVILSTIGPDGKAVPPDHRLALRNKANQLWHTDSSFKRVPALTSILSARIIPAHGGETEYVSTCERRRARGAAAAMLADGVEKSCERPRRDLPRFPRLCGGRHGACRG
jgi:alpha-ketoglutarate-dependent 2,4-dichlorophenoxyacetate dioxygenase